jgi:hypothetical protein
MFPTKSSQPLSFSEIASYWRREVTPCASFDEILNLLARAWWRGDLVAAGANRTGLLRTLYQLYSDCIIFAVSGLPEPLQTKELQDGSVEVALWLVPLPNTNPDTWNDENCAASFNAVAEFWDCDSFSLLTPIVGGLETTEKEFTRWVGSEGYPRPIFWASGEGRTSLALRSADRNEKLCRPEEPKEANETIAHGISGINQLYPSTPATPAPVAMRQPATLVESVQRESIAAAVEALWSGTVLAGIPVNKRDDAIIKWQRDNDRAVVSERTLRRYFSRT